MPELIIILVIALIFFGVGKLPEIGSGLGKAITGFRKATTEKDQPEDFQEKQQERRGKV